MSITITIAENPQELGLRAAGKIAGLLRDAIGKRGEARIILSTGASQFETMEALTQEDVDWTRVEMFHLDEYVELGESHIASFRKYLKERFVSKVNLKAAHFVNGEGDVQKNIAALSAELRRKVVDVGVIGIGENAHIAFNDPPADFVTERPYLVVELDAACRRQQLGEGWFASLDEVPRRAISMSIRQIMKSRAIVCTVPDLRKASAVRATMENPVDPRTPASILRTHPRCALFLDADSSSLLT